MKINKSYHYIQVDNRYVCVQQSFWSLFQLFYLKDQSFHLGGLGFTKRKRRHALIALMLAKLGSQSKRSELVLPLFGQLGLDVHQGYRIFDFRQGTVSKVLTPDVSQKNVDYEIESVCAAGRLSFAPQVYDSNLTERWYQEELISGSSGYLLPDADPTRLLEIYAQQIVPFICEMLLLHPPKQKKLASHLDTITAYLEDERFSRLSLNSNKLEKIDDFVKMGVNQLRQDGHRLVNLVFSHGDFSFVNVLNTAQGLRIIDWESVAWRNPLNDFYNYFFTELYYKRVDSTLVTEIPQAISILQTALQDDAPELAQDVSFSANLYRKLYYVERIKMLLERELNDKRLDVIVRSIDIFNQFEEAWDNSHSRVA